MDWGFPKFKGNLSLSMGSAIIPTEQTAHKHTPETEELLVQIYLEPRFISLTFPNPSGWGGIPGMHISTAFSGAWKSCNSWISGAA